MIKIALIAHNLRSAHNVGSLLRTAEGLRVQKLYFTGYTPYPLARNDTRLPHLSQKIEKQINKTALGAQKSQKWVHSKSITGIINTLRAKGYTIVALEQTKTAKDLTSYKPPEKIAIIVGNEVRGIEQDIVKQTDFQLEIPMLGKKESFNVVQASAMVLYALRYNYPNG